MIASFLNGATQAHYALLNATISAGKLSGLMTTPTIEIDGSSLKVGACSGLFGCGVFFQEDNTTSVSVTGLGQNTTTKTIAWEIDPQLYVQPQLVVLDSMKVPNYDPYHVVVAWIFYPGSNLTLTNGMIVGAPNASVSRILQFFGASEVNSKLLAHTTGTATAVLLEGWTSLISTTSIMTTWRTEFEVQSDDSPINCINVDVQLSSQALARLYFKRYGQSEVLVIDGTLSGPSDPNTWQIPLLRHRVQPWERFSIYLDITLGVGASAKIGSLAATNETIVSPQIRI